jgi:hypothetical protein
MVCEIRVPALETWRFATPLNRFELFVDFAFGFHGILERPWLFKIKPMDLLLPPVAQGR